MMARVFVEHWLSLYLGLLICCVVFFGSYILKKRRGKQYRHSFYVSDFNLPRSRLYAFTRNFSSVVLVLATIVLLFVAMGISMLTTKSHVQDENRYVLFAIDVSPSMAIHDIEGKSRLSVAKEILDEFLFSNHGAYVGVLVFAQSLRVVTPFSRDYNAIAHVIKHINIGELGNDSALADALLYCENMLDALEQHSTRRDLVFISDGVQNSGNVALSELQRYDFDSSIFFLHVGSDENGHFKYKNVTTNVMIQGYIKPFKSILLATLAQDINASYTRIKNTYAIPTIVGRMSVRHTDMRTLISKTTRVDFTEYFLLFFVILCIVFVLLRYCIIQSL